MHKKSFYLLVLIVFCSPFVFSQTSEFTYQGRLLDNKMPPTGTYDFQFSLWDAVTKGTQIGVSQAVADVAVTGGIFTVRLDFGAAAFADGGARFLEIEVKPTGGGEYTLLAPRQPLTSAPYSVRSQSAAQSDIALDAEKLGGVPASDYVTTSTVGNAFVKNDTAQQSANFNISGNGTVGGNLGVGTTTPQSKLSVATSGNGYGFTHTNGSVTVGSFINTGSGWLGTRSNHPLNFFTNDGGAAMQISTAGEVGIGVIPEAGWKLDTGGIGRFRTANGNINLGIPNVETGMSILPLTGNRADFRFNGSIITIAAGIGPTVPGNSGISVKTDGNVGIGTMNPTTKLQVEGIGGIGTPVLSVKNTGTGGSTILATSSPSGGYAVLADGDIYSTKNIRQEITGYGVVKAMIEVERDGTILRCYNALFGGTTGDCGFQVTQPLGPVGAYRIDFVFFSAAGRFFSITPRYASTCNVVPIQCRNAGANYAVNGNYLEVFTFNADNAADTSVAAFMVIVY